LFLRKGLFFAGLLVLGTGFYIVLLAIGIVPNEGTATPHWILGLAGMAFVVGGGLVCIGELLRHDDAVALRDLEVARAFRSMMIAFLLIIFAVLGNWVAFGPGTRPVQALLGLPFADITAQTSEWVGRFGFGIGALSLDLILLLTLVSILRWKRRAQPESE
jgi:hypothetical protein